MINIIMILLVLDVATTLTALNMGGIEQNVMLQYLSNLFNQSIEMIVSLTHIFALAILTAIKANNNKNKQISPELSTLTFLVLLVYVSVVTMNIIQIIINT